MIQQGMWTWNTWCSLNNRPINSEEFKSHRIGSESLSADHACHICETEVERSRHMGGQVAEVGVRHSWCGGGGCLQVVLWIVSVQMVTCQLTSLGAVKWETTDQADPSPSFLHLHIHQYIV